MISINPLRIHCEGWSIAVDLRERVAVALVMLHLADGDTITTMAGAVAGALHGAQRLPVDWIAAVHLVNPVDQDKLVTDLIGVLAERARQAATWAATITAQVRGLQ